jgi:hypothetical protein
MPPLWCYEEEMETRIAKMSMHDNTTDLEASCKDLFKYKMENIYRRGRYEWKCEEKLGIRVLLYRNRLQSILRAKKKKTSPASSRLLAILGIRAATLSSLS